MADLNDEKRNPGVLALDVGDVRIGVAVSESRIIATTLAAIDRRKGRKETLNAIEVLVEKYRVGTILLGLPLLEKGIEGAQAEKTRAFGRSLARRLPSPRIEFWDERYSSSEARDILDGGSRVEKGRIDSVAAAIILQGYLDSQEKSKKT